MLGAGALGAGTLPLRLARHRARLWPKAVVTVLDAQPTVTPATLAALRATGWTVEVIAADVFEWLEHPPADRVNAGQKMIYWIVVIGGTAVAVSGYILMFPFYGTNIADMQVAQIVHGVVAVLFIAAMLGHIYIGTIGMVGAFEAMGTGTVDENWAREHHSLWVDKKLAEERGAPPRGSMAPAE